jgi:hypothetical protein
LASSRYSSSSADGVDVLAVLTAFEEINQCQIEVKLFAQSTAKLGVLQVVISALVPGKSDVARAVLASKQLTLGYNNYRTIDQTILNGLYQLDAELARAELAKVKKQ